MIEELRKTARQILKNKQADLIIGYQRAPDNISAMPCLIEKENEIGNLIWDAYCVYNLTSYLKEFPGKRKGIVVKACDVKSIIVLLQEHQLSREELFIIGIKCSGVIDEPGSFAEKCKSCKSLVPLYCDILIEEEGKKQEISEIEQDEYGFIHKMEAKSIEERLKFWKEEFSRCIRCFACRQICPLCYCSRCVADQSTPAYFSKSIDLVGNFSWNVTRAMHLAGRCIDCGECERACPVGIPLRDLNKKIEKDIRELFDYEAGLNIEQKPVLSCFDKNDPADFIK